MKSLFFTLVLSLVCCFASATTEELLQHKIVLQAKEMKAEFMLSKLAEGAQFNLVLPSGFPGSVGIDLDAQGWPLSKVLDVVAKGTGTKWLVEDSHNTVVIKFEMTDPTL